MTIQLPREARRFVARVAAVLCAVGLLPWTGFAQDFTDSFDRDRCTFATSGSNPYFPLWPGYSLVLEGEEEDDEGEMVEISAVLTVTRDTQVIDGVLTRVFEERESEDGELVEVSRNFLAYCRETGDVWYFGEDVDDYEDGKIVSSDGEWRAGVDGAEPGILMPGSPLLGARFFEEVAPGVALDRGEVVALDEELDVPAGSFEDVLVIEDSSALAPEEEPEEKFYAPGVGIIKDEEIELVEVVLPLCLPNETTLCLANGRFRVTAEWEDFDGNEGVGRTQPGTDDSGSFWFFTAENTEILVKVLDACEVEGSNRYWVFAGGLTNLDVTLTVTDTKALQLREYENELGSPFEPVLDTSAFDTCP